MNLYLLFCFSECPIDMSSLVGECLSDVQPVCGYDLICCAIDDCRPQTQISCVNGEYVTSVIDVKCRNFQLNFQFLNILIYSHYKIDKKIQDFP